MADDYTIPSIFSDDPRTGTIPYHQLEARRKIAIALATRNRPYPKTIGEGLTALGEGLGEGYFNRNLDRAEAAQADYDKRTQKDLSSGAPAPVPGGASLEGDPTQAYAMVPPDTTEAQPSSVVAQAPQQPQMPVEEFKQRTARNWTPTEKDPYRAIIGPPNDRGDYGYGKYRVMGENIPPWTKQYLGKAMTQQQFLADDKAQEQLASARGSELLDKYGPNGAAAAWFGGEDGMKDQSRPLFQQHIAEYVKRFNIPLGNRDQITASAAKADPENAAPYQVAALGGGVPAPDTAPDQTRDAVAQSVLAQQGVQPPSPPQQVAQAGGLPLPPQQTVPTVIPKAIPPAPDQYPRPPSPGPEPKLRTYLEGDPQLVAQMRKMQEIEADPRTRPEHVIQARETYKKLEQRANDAFTKQWTIWHEEKKAEDAYKLTEEDKKLERVKARGETEDAAIKRDLTYRFGMDPAEGFKRLDKDQTAAELAQKVRDDNRIILKAVRDGVVMGTGAGWRVQANKLAAWALQNGYASEQAANTEILRALGGSRIRESLSQVNPVGVASNTDLLLARQLSGAEATMEPKSFMALLHKSSLHNSRLINDYEDKLDNTLGGHRAYRQYQLSPNPTAPQGATDEMLANRDDKMRRARYDDTYGEGSSALEIERFNRRQKRGQ